MADLRFDPLSSKDLDEATTRKYTCRVSRFLDAHGIPSVLWGELVMNMFLIPLVADGICIVIPDEHIDKARDLLLAAGFPPCQMGDYCPMFHPYAGCAVPYAHFNLVDRGPINYWKPEIFGENPREWHTLGLLKKSDVLWGAPEIPLGPPPPNDPDYWTVTDERLTEVDFGYQQGRMVEADYPVKIPSPARFAESLTLLYFRDDFPDETARGNHWSLLLLDMQVALRKYRLFELEGLPPRTRSWFTIVTKTPEKRVDAFERFAVEMRKAGEVPESSPWPSAVLGLPEWREELKQWREEQEKMRKKKEEEEEEQMQKKEEGVKEEQNA